MDQVFLITIILAAVVAGNVFARHLSAVPLPFFLIAIGAILAVLPVYSHFHLDPSAFSFAIIAPLLFNEAQNSSRLWIGRSITNIISLAIGLVIVTVLVVGISLYTLFPILPLSLAFALVAIVTPTDASAVNSIFQANPIAQEQAGILQNESLFNDAAGIVTFDVALTAYISGSFSLNGAIGTFLLEFLGGLVLGALLGLLIVTSRMVLIHYHDDTSLIMVSIQLITPFLVYLVATYLNLSGILAVVAAGLVQGSERNRLRLTSSRMQMVSRSVWEIVDGILSGSVFILLGLSLPDVINSMRQSQRLIWNLFWAAVFVYVAKTLLRLIWGKYLIKTHTTKKQSWRDSLIMALSGAHGTITLSLAFSIPVLIAGKTFIYRAPLIFMAAVIIFISLIMPTVFIPILLPTKKGAVHSFDWVRRMISAAIKALRQEKDHPAEAQVVIDALQQQLILNRTPNGRIRRQLMRESHAVERQAIEALHKQGKVTDDELKYYNEFISLNNFTADEKVWKNVILRLRFSLHFGKMYKSMSRVQEAFLTAPIALEEIFWRQAFENHGEDILPIEDAGYHAIMAFLKTKAKDNEVEAGIVRRFYQTRHRRIRIKSVDSDIIYQMFMKAFHAEYELIQAAVANKDITAELAEKLQQRISIDEITYLQNIEIFQK